MDEKNIALMKKLKALADRGVGGEQENARKMLDRLMKKYNVSELDLDDEKLARHDFVYHSAFDKKLLRQVIYKIATDRNQFRYTRGKGKRTVLTVECTKSEAVQIGIEYEFYRTLWDEEVVFFLEAFIQKHEIFDTKPGHATSEIDEERSRRMGMLIRGMQDKHLNPMLGSGDDE